MCFTSGGGCPQGSGSMTTYTACCTGDDPSNVANTMYQVNGGDCTICGTFMGVIYGVGNLLQTVVIVAMCFNFIR